MIDVHFLNEFKIYHVYVHAIVDLKLEEKGVKRTTLKFNTTSPISKLNESTLIDT